MLLGATPEIREMLSLLGVQVTLIDSSRNMMEKMLTGFNINTANEKWVEGDWFDISKIFKK